MASKYKQKTRSCVFSFDTEYRRNNCDYRLNGMGLWHEGKLLRYQHIRAGRAWMTDRKDNSYHLTEEQLNEALLVKPEYGYVNLQDGSVAAITAPLVRGYRYGVRLDYSFDIMEQLFKPRVPNISGFFKGNGLLTSQAAACFNNIFYGNRRVGHVRDGHAYLFDEEDDAIIHHLREEGLEGTASLILAQKPAERVAVAPTQGFDVNLEGYTAQRLAADAIHEARMQEFMNFVTHHRASPFTN